MCVLVETNLPFTSTMHSLYIVLFSLIGQLSNASRKKERGAAQRMSSSDPL